MGLKNENQNNINITNYDNTKEFLNKKRIMNNNKEKKPKNSKKNSSYNTSNEKKQKKNKNIPSVKSPSFNGVNNYNIINGNQIINNNYPLNRQYYSPFPYNIDIPLPSRFFEESINNTKK